MTSRRAGRIVRQMFGVAAGAALCAAVLTEACSRHSSRPEVTAASTAALGTFNVLTRCYDNTQDCANLYETTLTQSKVAGGGSTLARMSVDDRIFAQPLYASGVTIGGTAYNVLYVATMNDTVYAFDTATENLLWHVHYGTPPRSYSTIPGVVFVAPTTGCTDLSIYEQGNGYPGNVGIEGTPVIDGSTGAMYFVTAVQVTLDSGAGAMQYWLHSVNITDGSERTNSPVQITTTGFNELFQHQRAALVLANGTVYVAFASFCDHNPSGGTYHGYVFAYDATLTNTTPYVFDTTPSVNATTTCGQGGTCGTQSICGGGIWQSGAGPSVDSAGNVYVTVGNGLYDGTSLGDSVVKLAPITLAFDGGTGNFFTPYNQNELVSCDYDLGVSPPTLFPGSSTNLVQGGKDGIVSSQPKRSRRERDKLRHGAVLSKPLPERSAHASDDPLDGAVGLRESVRLGIGRRHR